MVHTKAVVNSDGITWSQKYFFFALVAMNRLVIDNFHPKRDHIWLKDYQQKSQDMVDYSDTCV